MYLGILDFFLHFLFFLYFTYKMIIGSSYYIIHYIGAITPRSKNERWMASVSFSCLVAPSPHIICHERQYRKALSSWDQTFMDQQLYCLSFLFNTVLAFLKQLGFVLDLLCHFMWEYLFNAFLLIHVILINTICISL